MGHPRSQCACVIEVTHRNDRKESVVTFGSSSMLPAHPQSVISSATNQFNHCDQTGRWGCVNSFRYTLCLLFWVVLGVANSTPAAPGKDWRDEWDVPDGFSMSIDTEGFNFPSAIAFVPNPGPDPKSPLYFVTEMRGKVKVVTRDRSVFTFAEVPFDMTPVKELPDLEGEAGMAAIALDPSHGYVFVSLAYYDTNHVLRNAMVRFDSKPATFDLKATNTTPFTSVFRNDISILTHQAGAMVIEGDTLFVGIGDGGQHYRTQNLDSTLGKILRMSLDGQPLPDNPFFEDADSGNPRNYIWALGLRNPFGLARVNGRMFVSENGLMIDRFLEVHQGENCGWNGTDWSIGMNAPMVIGPAVCPVQIAWLPPENTVFPPEYRSKFFVALGGGAKKSPGVLMIDYDFANSRLARPPKHVMLHLTGDLPGVYPVGVAFGPDGLYVVSLFSVREKGFGKGEVIRLSHNAPLQASPSIGQLKRAEVLMQTKGCRSCHSMRESDLNVAPALDRETLIPRILTRLKSDGYKRTVSRLDTLDTEPYNSFRQARREVMSRSGTEQARMWIKYHLLQPQFDRIGAAMPLCGLTENEAQAISDYLVERNIGDVGITGFFKKIIHPYIYGPVGRRHLPGAFAMGFFSACGLLLIGKWKRKVASKRRAHRSIRPSEDVSTTSSRLSGGLSIDPIASKTRSADWDDHRNGQKTHRS